MLQNSVKLFLFIILLTGCAVKKDDSGLTKLGKHTVNSPIYAGEIITTVISTGVVLVATAPIRLLKEDKKENQTLEMKDEDGK